MLNVAEKLGLVIDTATGLMWDRFALGQNPVTGGGTAISASHAWAVRRIERLNSTEYKGYNDWRLPKVAELLSISEDAEAFEPMPMGWFFSSETDEAEKECIKLVTLGPTARYGGRCGIGLKSVNYIKLVRKT